MAMGIDMQETGEADTADLDAQIAALQRERQRKLDAAAREAAKRDKEARRVLVGSTPGKGTRDTSDPSPVGGIPRQPDFKNTTRPARPPVPPQPQPPPRTLSRPPPPPPQRQPGPSNMSHALAALRRAASSGADQDGTNARPPRATAFVRRPLPNSTSQALPSPTSQPPNPTSQSHNSTAQPPNPTSQPPNPTSQSHNPTSHTQHRLQAQSANHTTAMARPDHPKPPPADELEVEDPTRESASMTVVERLTRGPKAFGRDPEGEDVWEFVEPNSGIRLSERKLPHAHLQDHLFGRYYLSPSLLYSVIRLSKDGATYDVPVEGDWITIAVVAERGEIRVSGSKESLVQSDDDDVDNDADAQPLSQGKPDKGQPKQGDKRTQEQRDRDRWRKRRGPRKYINLKLCALPPRGTKQGGEACLQLLLFEADAILSQEPEHDGGETTKSYRGGSGGAYERWCNLNIGDVVAILNPRVLRPLRSGSQAPHPLTLPLALNPNSADAIMLIGHAMDLGCCTAQQRDGNRCKSWVDLRESQVCEYHVHAAVQRSRAGRAEFTASTSSFALQARPVGGKTKVDVKKKTGLLPGNGPQAAPRDRDNGGGGATYLVGGNTVNTARLRDDGGLKHFGDEHLSEKLGRSRAGKRKRKLEENEAEKALQSLLERDSGKGSQGAKYLKAVEGFKKAKLGVDQKGGDKGKHGSRKGGVDPAETSEDGRKRPFSAGAIKRIGFDPSARSGVRDGEDVAKRLEAIAGLRDADRPVKLGRPAGTNRSNVRAPLLPVPIAIEGSGQVMSVPSADEGDGEEGMIDLD